MRQYIFASHAHFATGIKESTELLSGARDNVHDLSMFVDGRTDVAEEAAKQSGRGVIPAVGFLPDLAEAFNKANATALPLFMYETGERETLREAVESAGNIASAAILTGPEGGFEPFEAELARIMKLHICSMGPRIFRCETAPVAALSALMYATGNM